MPQFTLEQKKAHDHQRHVSITANAGSGKTSVLVSRYCDLMEYRGYDPSEVAAITFTEKAAAELRSRIAREIESRLGDEEHRDCWERLKTVRERFPAAVVTTIHGFCGQIIREYPIVQLAVTGTIAKGTTTISSKIAELDGRKIAPQSKDFRAADKIIQIAKPSLQIRASGTTGEDAPRGIILQPHDMEEISLLTRVGNEVEIR